VQGGMKVGHGLLVDCIEPIIQRKSQRSGANKPLPRIDQQVVAECRARNPNYGQGHAAPSSPTGPSAPRSPPKVPAIPPSVAARADIATGRQGPQLHSKRMGVSAVRMASVRHSRRSRLGRTMSEIFLN
jgi:hypothetical protein